MIMTRYNNLTISQQKLSKLPPCRSSALALLTKAPLINMSVRGTLPTPIASPSWNVPHPALTTLAMLGEQVS